MEHDMDPAIAAQWGFHVRTCWTDGDLHLVITGELDIATVPIARNALHEAMTSSADVVFELTDTTFVDSTALGFMVGTRRRLAEAGHRLTIANPRPSVLRVLEIAGISGLADVRSASPSVAAAPAAG